MKSFTEFTSEDSINEVSKKEYDRQREDALAALVQIYGPSRRPVESISKKMLTTKQLEKEIMDFVKSYNKLATFLKANYITVAESKAMDKAFYKMMHDAGLEAQL
jgi:hypothetical protein